MGGARRVLLAASEVYPLAKTGGLGDYVAGIAKALARNGCDVALLLPGYPQALERLDGNIERFDLGTLPGFGHTSLAEGSLPSLPIRVWLIDCPVLYCRTGGLYQDEAGVDWPDNALRFALLARVGAVLALGHGPSRWHPEIVHLHDWQTGPIAALIAQEGGVHPSCIFTIHNMAFQGLFGPDVLEALGLSRAFLEPTELEFWGRVSFLKAGIRYADQVTTVSETYAREILTPAFGCGLDGALRERDDGVIGIRNGIDEEEWNPATDRFLPATYTEHDLTGKVACKAGVRARFGLEAASSAPVVAYLCRLTEQKMADLVLAALPELVAHGLQVIVMGCGDRALEAAFRASSEQFAGRVGVLTAYDEEVAHLLVAGADILLAPARFEPCGLTQMYAMRYGTIPVASRVGGLAETIFDLSESSSVSAATGFLFDEPLVSSLVGAVERAVAWYRQPFLWRKIIANAMRADFSWEHAAQRYLKLYEDITPPSPAQRRDRSLQPRAMSRSSAVHAFRARMRAVPRSASIPGSRDAPIQRPTGTKDARADWSDY
jgi:starch synthase